MCLSKSPDNDKQSPSHYHVILSLSKRLRASKLSMLKLIEICGFVAPSLLPSALFGTFWASLFRKKVLQIIMYSSLTCCKKLRNNTFCWTEREFFNICDGCGMPTGDAYSSGHLVPSLWDYHKFYLLRPFLSLNLSLFFRTLLFEYPSVLSRFCFIMQS